MRLISAHLKNFRQHADTQLHFADGVTGLSGQNEAGKTSILESLAWAIYGGKALRAGTKGVRWHGAAARQKASVTWILEINGQLLEVHRSENTANVKQRRRFVTADDGSPLARSHKGVTEFMSNLMGMSLGEFQASYLCGQKDIARIATMKPVERQTFIREVMGAGTLDTKLKSLRTIARSAKEDAALARAEIGGVDAVNDRITECEKAVAAGRSRLAAAREALDDKRSGARFVELERMAAAFDETKREHDTMLSAYRHARSEYNALKTRIDDEKGRRSSREVNESDHEDRKRQLQYLPSKREQLVTLETARNEAAKLDVLMTEKAAIEKALAEVEADKKEIEQTIDRYDQLKHDEQLATIAEARNVARALRGHAAELDGRIEAALERREKILVALAPGEEGSCPTCGQSTAPEILQGAADLLDEQIEHDRTHAHIHRRNAENRERVLGDAERAASQMQDFKAQAEAAVRRFGKVRERESNLSIRNAGIIMDVRECDADLAKRWDRELHGSLTAEVADLTELETQVAIEREKMAEWERMDRKIEEWLSQLHGFRRRLEDDRKAIDDLAYDAKRHAEVVGKLEEARSDIHLAEIDVARAEEQMKAFRKEHAAAKRALDEWCTADAHVTNLEVCAANYAKAAERFNDFRVAVLSGIRPEMEELVSGFVQVLTEGRHDAVTLTDTFGPTLYENHVPCEVVSGGTEDVVAFAMRLAISRMITERSGQPMGLLVLDEPFTSLDASRRAGSMSLLAQLTDVFPQIIVISHLADVASSVDQTIELEYDLEKGCAHVV